MFSRTTAMTLTLASFSMMTIPAANAQESDSSSLIPREVLFGNPERTSVQISPDGKYIGYIAPHEGVLNIWVQSVDGSDPRALTSFTDRPIRGYSWAWNSEQMLFGRDKDGDENTHIHAVDITDGSVKDLTPYPGVKAMTVDKAICLYVRSEITYLFEYYCMRKRRASLRSAALLTLAGLLNRRPATIRPLFCSPSE